MKLLRKQTGARGTRGAVVTMDEDTVKSAYRRWAPVYDHTFGKFASRGRRHAVEIINQRQGRVLEVGVGTGLSLPDYERHLEIVGIDLSPEMLEKARERVASEGLDHVTSLHEMDASALSFKDESFDTTVAMYVMTVVPEPEKVMRELDRVTKVGGEVMLVNHFSQTEGVRGWVERRMAPFADKLGWHPVFDQGRVMVCDNLELVEARALRPWGIFTMLRFAKRRPTLVRA
ncbi:MAG TPA: class I SAM-dependent methyltransferase [Hyphomicrobiaceae bacterium]|nr:class I SAM-dependent methyltransferase [Hyphomicrobiaceae bacterium]